VDRDHETFVVRSGLLRVVLLSVLLVAGATVFLFLAAVAGVIDVSGFLTRGALLLLALFLAALAVYFLLALSTNALRIEVGPELLTLRLPRARGPLPLLGLIRAQLPYDAIASVERREEVYVSFGLVTVQHAFSLVTRDGARLPLGVMAENWGYQLPFDQAAQKIAERAGCSVIDRGAVRVGGVFHAMARDLPPWTIESMPPLERKRWDRRATRTMQFLMLLIVSIFTLRACFGS
jgi:hypothetical protein